MAQHLEDIGKETYLENNGYTWDESYEVYLNKEHWKIFSKEYIEYQPFDTLMARLEEAITPNQWQIYTMRESEEDIHNMRMHYGAK
jgi:hypothetical protein